MPILPLHDVDLYYEVEGDGTPVLFIQGVGVVGECWRPQITELRKRYQTVVFDNRGIGKSLPSRGAITIESMAADARALMDALRWESAHVVGHSMGGVIAQQLALDCPGRVRSLSLLCTFARGRDAARITPWVLWMTLRTRLGTRQMRRRAFLEMLWPANVLRNVDVHELASRVACLAGRDLADSPPILMKQVAALRSHDTSLRLGELTGVPTLVLSADQDPIALPRFGQMIAERLPGARFELLREASHGVTIHKAAEINQGLATFLN